jgi:hypothetical protein
MAGKCHENHGAGLERAKVSRLLPNLAILARSDLSTHFSIVRGKYRVEYGIKLAS